MKYTYKVATVIAVLSASLAHAAVIYVHSDSSMNTIQTGLNSCAPNDTVLVAPGVYYENLVWPSTQGIDLVSESGASVTTIDGNGSGSVIALATGVNSTTTIKGFTITNGTGTPNPWGYPSGGGIYCAWSSPTINENILKANITTYYGDGGGLYCVMSSPIIEGNTIEENFSDGWGGGICCVYHSNPVIRDNVISENSSIWQGGGVACIENVSAIITNNTITENVADPACVGGIFIYYYCEATIERNTIKQNTGNVNAGGIAITEHCSAVINNNIISENISMNGYGGGLGIGTYSSATIIGNTISQNSALTRGGGLVIGEASYAEVSDNTISENSVSERGGGIAIGHYCTVTMTNNTITENIAGERGGGIAVINNCAISLKGSNIIDNKGDYGGGIGFWDNCSVSIDSCCIAKNEGDGIYCEDNCSLTASYNDIYENTCYGIQNLDATTSVNAINNWWADASGPGGTGPGTGDEVSDFVNFDPWLTVPVIPGDGGEVVKDSKNNGKSSTDHHVSLNQNVPNPFKNMTQIRYEIANAGHVALDIYNLAGQKVITLIDAQQESGIHQITWNGKDTQGRTLPNGVYFCKISHGEIEYSKKMMLLK
jgi:hypothetical protein